MTKSPPYRMPRDLIFSIYAIFDIDITASHKQGCMQINVFPTISCLYSEKYLNICDTSTGGTEMHT